MQRLVIQHMHHKSYTGPRIFIKASWIILSAFCWSLLLPGAVAFKRHVFYRTEIAEKLPSNRPNSLNPYYKYLEKSNKIGRELSMTDSLIYYYLSHPDIKMEISGLLQTKAQLTDEQLKAKSPIYISGFYDNMAVYYTFIAYIFLGFLTFITLPVKLKSLNWISCITVASLIYTTWMFSNWLRNFVFYDQDRTIFVFVNYDVDSYSFFLQEFRILGICLLISLICQSWTIHFRRSAQDINNLLRTSDARTRIIDLATCVTENFNEWRTNSVLLCGGFLPWTFLYWGNIISIKDSRYLISALVLHLVWAITWLIISLPVFFSFSAWSEEKIKYLKLEIKTKSNLDIAPWIGFMKEITPITNLQITAAGIASFFSLLIPFINLIFR